ncbi:hypothetical protein KEM54_004931 [Ascosphaera aggregata]|nr:hypothetical protein KEM54_004931 [Ascosphaera aggregata]
MQPVNIPRSGVNVNQMVELFDGGSQHILAMNESSSHPLSGPSRLKHACQLKSSGLTNSVNFANEAQPEIFRSLKWLTQSSTKSKGSNGLSMRRQSLVPLLTFALLNSGVTIEVLAISLNKLCVRKRDRMAPPSVLMVGTGEYTTGFVGNAASKSDKKVGVVALTMFDLRRRGKVGDLSMVGITGEKYPAIKEHMKKNISEVYNGLDVSFAAYPEGDGIDYEAYKPAIDALPPGSAITIFTPDNTHYPIALYAVQHKIHVLVTKPATQLLKHHLHLLQEARKNGVFVYVEHHKRFDPAYSDARAKAKNLGDFNYFYSYMSQPKSQLETFSAWAGKSSDISYYLNSHHIDVCESMVPDYVPVRVNASASKGTAVGLGCVPGTEDTITLLVEWRKKNDPEKTATGVYTSSWTAPQKAGVHSNQYFHYLASRGEIRVDQAKRGYDVTDDAAGQLQWVNPFYMRYAPDEEGNFNGQTGYGYISFEKFIDAVTAVNEGKVTLDELDKRGLPTLRNTIATTAILQAGRVSLDEKKPVEIVKGEGDAWALK